MNIRHSFLSAVSVGAAIALSVVAVGCSSDADPKPEQREAGALAMALDLGSSVHPSSVHYEITGPNYHDEGELEVRGNTISARFGGLPAGSGYSLDISAADARGAVCEAHETFRIRVGQTTRIDLVLRCRLPRNSGSVLVNGSVNVCPLVDAPSVLPASAAVGQSVTLTAVGSDDDAAPNALAFSWTGAEEIESTETGSTATFTCEQEGSFEVSVSVSDGDCDDAQSVSIECSAAELSHVYPVTETAPVAHSGDAADDPAIWVNPTDPSASVIIGTDKSSGGGLAVYALDGSLIQTVTAGQLNNVDLRDGFPLGGQSTTLVTAGNRTDNTIAIYTLDPVSRTLSDASAGPVTTTTTYGSCMYHSAVSGKFYYFVDSKAGKIEQWELSESSQLPGKVTATKVRELKQLGTQPEACVADDDAGTLYVGEEDVGVWKFDAEPEITSGSGWEGELIADVSTAGHLVADVEGLALVRTGSSTGYLLVSNQGDNTFAVLDRQAPHAWIKTFSVDAGQACVDEVTGSDGIEASSANLGPAFPHGLFVTQDDTNDEGNQNFKLVPLDFVFGATDPEIGECTPEEPEEPEADAGAGEGGAGWGEQFCLDFCQKCEACYATGEFSEGDCHYLTSKPNFDSADCAAGCAVGMAPGAEAFEGLTSGWQAGTCADFDDAM